MSEENKQLKNEQLENVSGGWGDDKSPAYFCPHCGSDDFIHEYNHYGVHRKTCNECGTIWDFDNNGNIVNIILPEQYEDPEEAAKNILKLREQIIKKFKR